MNEPQWLRQSRLEGWQAFETLPTPRWTKGIAQWWTTDVSVLDLDKMRAYVPSNLSASQAEAEVNLGGDDEATGSLLVQVNSETAFLRVPDDVKAQGVIFCSLEEAVREHSSLVEKYLHKLVAPNTDKFAALHTALWSGGVFLYVPEGVTVDLPVHVVYRLTTPGAVALGHTLVVAEKGANVRYVEEFHSTYDEGQALHSGVVEVSVGENAKVEFTSMQEWNRNVFSFATRYAQVGKRGLMHWVIGEMGAKSDQGARRNSASGRRRTHVDPGHLLRGQRPALRQHLEHPPRGPRHLRRHPVQGRVRDTSRLGFEGLIKVDHGAQKTDSYLTMNTLFLSEGAKANSVPGLEILADDVRCSHGATVGTVRPSRCSTSKAGASRNRGRKADSGRFLRARHRRDAARIGPPEAARHNPGESGAAQVGPGSSTPRTVIHSTMQSS